LCQANSPFTLTTMASQLLRSPPSAVRSRLRTSPASPTDCPGAPVPRAPGHAHPRAGGVHSFRRKLAKF
jgi:hypothetical protein